MSTLSSGANGFVLALRCIWGKMRAMERVANRDDLEGWLADKPANWARVIATRCALRVVPVATNQNTLDGHPAIVQAMFRASIISWTSCNWPALNVNQAADAAADAADYAAATADDADAANDATYAAANAADATINTDAEFAAAYAANAADAAADAASRSDIWRTISGDLALLGKAKDASTAARQLANRALWQRKLPDVLAQGWTAGKAACLAKDPNFRVWIDWYERRVRGERAAFDIPGDRYRKEDKAILRRLADATDEDFWDRGAAYVNAELTRWLEEARERAAERAEAERARQHAADSVLEELFSDDASAALPSQNTHALTFRSSESGKVAIDASAALEALRTNDDAVDRHAEALAEARDLLKKCAGSNAGARLTRLLENYIQAAGDSIDQMRPSLFVQRGEKLRQEVAAYGEPGNMLNPISDELLVDLRSWRSSHNMVVGLDPALNALDTAQLGPDTQPAMFPPDDLRKLTADADQAELLEDDVPEILEETAEIAPTEPDPADRRTVWSVETGKNLVIEIFAMALNNKYHAGASLLWTGSFATHPLTTISVSGAGLAATHFLLKHREWIEQRLGNTPTWHALFEALCEKLDRHTPFGSSNDKSGRD